MRRSIEPSVWLHCAGAAGVGAWVLLAWRSQTGGGHLAWMLGAMAGTWMSLAVACRVGSDRATWGILLWATLFRVAAFFASPVMEDDHHRFLWDGYRFAVAGDPYAAPPQASFGDPTVPPAFREILDHINHPAVPTIYGPLTEWMFRLGHAIAPAQLWPWKLMLLGADLVVLLLLWTELPTKGRLMLAWCPLAIFETGFNAHPDALALALVVVAWWLGRRGRIVAVGIVAGLAISAKIFAVLLVPFLLWRHGRRAWLAATAAVAVLYAPFWLRGSAADLAGLRAMAGEWEFNSSIYALVAAMTSPAMARAVCGLIFIGVWLAIFRRWSQTSRESLPPGEWVYGAFLLLSAVANPWYALWLWPFVAMRPSATGITALAAVSLAYVTGLNLGDPSLGNFGHPWWLRPVEFGLIGWGAWWDWRKRKTRP